MLRPALRVSLALALAALSPGCRIATMVAGNAEAFFARPAPAPYRTEHPFRPEARLAVLWIGHASTLIQMDDKLVLVDPVFTETVGQLSRRLIEPGLRPEDLPPVDAVLVSHMHFDHLSIGSLALIERKVGFLVVPQKGTVNVPDFSFETIELPTFLTLERDGLRITATPVRHKGFRWAIDEGWMDGMGFTGYVIEYHGLTVYFGGDTAYDQARFEATHARFPSVDLAILPIAPINPRSLLQSTHIDPREALAIFRLLGARWMVPVHHSTFVNSIDPPGEALRVLRREMAVQGFGEDRVQVLEVGEQRVLIPRNAR